MRLCPTCRGPVAGPPHQVFCSHGCWRAHANARRRGPVEACARVRCHRLPNDTGFCDVHSQTVERSWTLADRISDLLALDGGWLTADGISVDLECHPESAERSLRQLERDGLVLRRRVVLTVSQWGRKGSWESRTEWRAA